MFTSLFHDHGFSVVEFESALILHGPFSWRSPIIDEDPGPPQARISSNSVFSDYHAPFIHIDSGAFFGSFLDSKNQKKVFIV